MTTFAERQLQKTQVGIDASQGNVVYRIPPARYAVPFSLTDYVRTDTTRNSVVITDGESLSEPLTGYGEAITILCDGQRNRVARTRVMPRSVWTLPPDMHDSARVLTRWASNRYDGVNQDWVFTAATPFATSPAGTSIFVPANTLRAYGFLRLTFAGLLTGDGAANIALRCGLLRNDVNDSNGATFFDGAAGGIDNVQVSNTAASPATPCPFRLTMDLIPVATEGARTSPLLVEVELMCTTTNGLALNTAKPYASTTISTTAVNPTNTPFDSTIDNKIVPVFRKGTAGTATWDFRSMTAIHFAERRY